MDSEWCQYHCVTTYLVNNFISTLKNLSLSGISPKNHQNAKKNCKKIQVLIGLTQGSHSQARSHYCTTRRLLAAGFPPWPDSPLLSRPGCPRLLQDTHIDAMLSVDARSTEHQKIARSKGYSAQICGKNLVINNEVYSAAQLERSEIQQDEHNPDPVTSPQQEIKSASVPSTPTTSQTFFEVSLHPYSSQTPQKISDNNHHKEIENKTEENIKKNTDNITKTKFISQNKLGKQQEIEKNPSNIKLTEERRVENPSGNKKRKDYSPLHFITPASLQDNKQQTVLHENEQN
ncbi:hypothetical protein JTB14_011111 [Gonioctena quinquepunctata]|nr:hypothetical protein JTB14_011111 [Gonioctena quinquepunctata]